MLLSVSELFWVGLAQGTLAAPSIEPPETPDWWKPDSASTLYHTIIRFADLCGLGQAPIQHLGDEQECEINLADLHWGYRGGIISSAAVEEGRELLSDSIAASRAGLRRGNPSGEIATRFDELLEERSPILYGYSPQTPEKLYGMKKSGRVVVATRIEPMPPGILQVLLRLVAPHLDTPPMAFMALAATGDVSPGWHSNWAPAASSIHEALQPADPPAALEVIERELIGPAREDPAYRLGHHVAKALRTLNTLGEWICLELQLLDDASMPARMLDFIPSKPAKETAADDDESPGEQDDVSSDAEDGADVPDPGHDPEYTPTNIWAKEIDEVVKSACVQFGYGDVEAPPANQDIIRVVGAVRQDLKHAVALASQLRIDTVIPTLEAGIRLTDALLNEDAACDGASKGTWYGCKMRCRQNLLDYPETLQGVIPLAFGELRLSELLHDTPSHGLEASSLRGWSRLVENARAGIREGFSLLKQGYRPYVIINVAQATLETIVKALAEKHLSTCPGADLGAMLHELYKHAEAGKDTQLKSVASVGMALRWPRNHAVHDPHRTYDKHDAAFFLNGLAIMMRAIA